MLAPPGARISTRVGTAVRRQPLHVLPALPPRPHWAYRQPRCECCRFVISTVPYHVAAFGFIQPSFRQLNRALRPLWTPAILRCTYALPHHALPRIFLLCLVRLNRRLVETALPLFHGSGLLVYQRSSGSILVHVQPIRTLQAICGRVIFLHFVGCMALAAPSLLHPGAV